MSVDRRTMFSAFNLSADRRSTGAVANGHFASPVSSRDRIRDRHFPNLILTTQEGTKVRFYDDLIKDKIVDFWDEYVWLPPHPDKPDKT